MTLDADAVRKIAFLARLKVPVREIDALGSDLSKILGWIEQLSEVNTENVEPMTSVSVMELWKRQDEVVTEGSGKEVLLNAPDTESDFFVVPKVVE